jgi:hypothetical protein
MLAYHPLASAQVQKRIEEMFVGFADHWRKIDYLLGYFGNHWNVKRHTDAYNAVFVMLNAIAYRFSKNPVHLQEAKNFYAYADWMRETNVGSQLRRRLKNGPTDRDILFKEVLREDETICWETNHAKFLAVAVENILAVAPELIGSDVDPALKVFWETWPFGLGEDLLPYYWFAVNARTKEWRPLEKTAMLPPDKCAFGDPFMGYISQVRYTASLTRFMYISVVAAKHCRAIAKDARGLAMRIMEKIDRTRLKWMIDPDGQQLIPELRYMGQVLDSELAPTYVATYWRGRLENLW